jgi:hypothetical protein
MYRTTDSHLELSGQADQADQADQSEQWDHTTNNDPECDRVTMATQMPIQNGHNKNASI